MPPAAATVAGRRSARPAANLPATAAPRRASAASARAELRTEVRRPARPAGRPSGRATAAAAALEATLAPAPALPRREAPARRSPEPRRPARETPSRRAAEPRRGRAHDAPRLSIRRPPAPRLDRIVRGRAWIPVLGATLVAIVGMRVEVLKLGSSVGRELQQATTLESANSALRAQNSALSDSQRIMKLAELYGMQMPNVLDIHFVHSTPGHGVAQAIRNITAPSRTTFLSGLASERQTNQQDTLHDSTLSAIGGPAVSLTSTSIAGTTATATGGVSSGLPAGSTSTPISGGAALTAASSSASMTSSSGSGQSMQATSTGAGTGTGSVTGAATGSGGTSSTSSTSGGLPSGTPQSGTPAASSNGGAALAG